MFPHFSLRRERSALLHKFLLLLVLSHSVLVLVWSFFGLVLSGLVLHGGRGVHRVLSRVDACLSVVG